MEKAKLEVDNTLNDSEMERAKQDALITPYIRKLLDYYLVKKEDVIYESLVIMTEKFKTVNTKMKGLNVTQDKDLKLFSTMRKEVIELITTIEMLKAKSDGTSNKKEENTDKSNGHVKLF